MRSFTNSVLMIRPSNFGYNVETAGNNAFQTRAEKDDQEHIRNCAIEEFDAFVELLKSEGVDVHVWQDSDTPAKPDAVFPNNWFSTTPEGALLTYPMFAENRRLEREEKLMDYVEEQFIVERRYHFEQYEEKSQFLEGTGSVLFDHDNKLVYACLSPRTHITLLDKLSVLLGYEMVAFHSEDENGVPIYHTNVMMALGEDFAVVCADSIRKEDEREKVFTTLNESGRKIVEISMSQVRSYTGNMIQLLDGTGNPIMVMSKQASKALNADQRKTIEQSARIVTCEIPTIEKYGGGSARCMIAEIFLQPRPAFAN